uniref:Uncharacterized protein n=1 Tax=Pristionchus pacificus TaxID=54126 RepID=A0A2A6BPV9_PRIPA|eukprot:PDM67927.1 hypothetical protein PRIPAC_45971 [Pristionchus pacificus]
MLANNPNKNDIEALNFEHCRYVKQATSKRISEKNTGNTKNLSVLFKSPTAMRNPSIRMTMR